MTSLDDFLARLGPGTPRVPATRLWTLLGKYDGEAALSSRLDWIEDLGDWVLRSGGRIPVAPNAPPEPHPTRRLRMLVHACDQVPEARETLSAAIGAVVAEASAVRLLSETGLPGSHGFFRELSERLVRRFLPAPRTDRELADLVLRVFSSARSTEWLSTVPRPLVTAFATHATSGGAGSGMLRTSALDAIELLAMRAAVLGLSDDVRVRGPRSDVSGSPFRSLHTLFQDLAEGARSGAADDADSAQARGTALRECRAFVREVLTNLDRSGVSVDLVYRLELLSKSLLRLERMSQAVLAPDGDTARVAADLFVRLLADASRDRSVIALFHANLRQLSRKIVERAGESGEHYITSSRAEWRRMLGSASGGGLLTVGTTIMKMKVHALHPPLFFEGLFASANYATSFIGMQLLGFTLATKQPSMTAAALAHELAEEEEGGKRDLAPLVDQISRISRSQLAAAFANVLMVVFAACLIETVLRSTGRSPILEAKEAAKLIASLHPFASGTIVFAALTGVILWASSVGAGWFENWAVYQRIPEGLAASRRLRRTLGAARAERFAAWFSRNLSGFGGNVTLGLLLGMVPVFGEFFGLPLEVRHVTLSMGSLAFAGFGAAEVGFPYVAWLWAFLGIAIIGLLNFGVSFVLALEVALRARDVGRTGHWALVKAVARRLGTSPREFFLPPREMAPNPAQVAAGVALAADGGVPVSEPP